MADAIRQAVADALGVELRVRAAEQRAQDAVAGARNTEARMEQALRDVAQLRMDRYVCRQAVIRALPDIASGRIEAAIDMVCHAIDSHLSSEGDDGWRVTVQLNSWVPEQRMSVCVYWPVSAFRRMLEARYNVYWPNELLIMHGGIELVDSRALSDYDLYSASHGNELPIFYLSQRS